MTTEEYLRRVEWSLRDLPWGMRRRLVADLRAHLAEAPSLDALGTPEEYAADLRAAEGIERRRGPIAFLRARRPRNVAAAVVVLTLIGLAIGAVEWVDSYQPLVFGNGTMDPQGAVPAPTGGEWVVFHEGRPFRYGFTVRNDGRFTVRVVGSQYPYGLPVSVRLLMSGPTRNGGMPLPSGPFRPVDLKPGYTLVLYWEGVFHARRGSCGPGGYTEAIDEFPVRYRFLWRTTTTFIPLPEELAVVTKKSKPCR